MLTCKQFLQELDQYLEKSLDAAQYAELQKHVNECPNCFVVCDTTEKTLKVFKGMDCQPVPTEIRNRVMAAVEKKFREKCKTEAAEKPEDLAARTAHRDG